MRRVAIFTATRWEYAAVRRIVPDGRAHRHGRARWIVGLRGRCEVVVVRTGVGPERAAAACRDVLRGHPVDLAVSAGVACALVPAQVGDLLVGTDVRMEADGRGAAPVQRACAGDVVGAAVRVAEGAGLPVRTGSFVTARRILWRSADKQAVAERTGAVGLDMESAALAEAAAEQGVPFAIIRSVSDLADEDLPVDFNLFLTPSGWLAGLAAMAETPTCLGGFLRLRRQMRTASDRLSRFFERFVDELA